jgi:hypothetical protein
MSATGRGTEREAHDAYPTPPWTVWRLLEALDLPGGLWLEPCAGDGAIIRAVNEKRSDVRWAACEVRPECEPELNACGVERVEIGDFFALPQWSIPVSPAGPISVVITNPPYSMAEKFVRRCCELSPVVVMLLSLHFLASRERHGWISQFVPDVFVLPNRPSFRGKGTDASEYAWMVFERDAKRSRGFVQVVALTSKQDRKRSICA